MRTCIDCKIEKPWTWRCWDKTRNTYVDDIGRLWAGRRCPDCKLLYSRKYKPLIPKTTRACLLCAKQFYHHHAKFCSKECKRLNHNARVAKRSVRATVRKFNCIRCNMEFETKHKRRLCSKRCRARVKPPIRQCENCSLQLKSRGTYCGNVCWRAHSPKYKALQDKLRIERSEVLKDPENKRVFKQKMKKYKKASRKRRKIYERTSKLGWIKNKDVDQVYLDCPPGMQVDHIIPLRGEAVCGLHVPWNLQYLTLDANARKGNYFDGTYDNLSWIEKLLGV